ncbi:MAG: flagellar hook-basal body protein, partial [Paenibacillus sp.]|nr:flagellar hook-basal body protein [Paenibacillus sp.]
MLRGLYTAASGMMTQQRRHDTVTNNIANMNTPGYKSVNSVQRSFPEMMIKLMGTDEASG